MNVIFIRGEMKRKMKEPARTAGEITFFFFKTSL